MYISEAVDIKKYILSLVWGENVEANFNIYYKWWPIGKELCE
jgi:hypothetical protein